MKLRNGWRYHAVELCESAIPFVEWNAAGITHNKWMEACRSMLYMVRLF